MGKRTSRDLESELTRAEEESEHWKVTCLVLRHHYSDLKNKYIEYKEKQVKKKGFDEGFEKKTEISEKDGDSNVIVYKRRRQNKDIREDDEQREKCECVQLNWEIDVLEYGKQKANEEIEGLKNQCLDLEVQGDLLKMRCKQLMKKTVVLEKETSEREKIQQERINCLEKECVQLNKEVEYLKLGNKRQAGEIGDLRIKCMDLEIQETLLLDHETELRKELEDCRNKCRGLSAELEQKKMELANLLEINGGREDYRTKCIELEEHIKGLVEEGIVMYERERSAHERICVLEEVAEKLETKEIERCVQLNTENRKLEDENRKLEDDKIDSLTKRFMELETRLLRVEEENSTLRGMRTGVSCEKTCRETDGVVHVANAVHLTRTETSLNSAFTPASCKPSSSLQVNSDGVHASDLAHVNNQCKSVEGGKDYFASASGHQVGFETQGALTMRKCSGIPSSENLALVRQEDGARPSTTSSIVEIVEIDSDGEIVDISDDEEDK
ncbi:hypothetical protein C5167_036086 [Papaver somniferum]|uniref:paramyosin-like n=1 Tax=Papaver somniferum TaxID=3469 RepID=UPI000E6F957D|nr:paramyosin-like [Papaver somniferum]RZC87549.1 hypothetical protein C5167_036086 [Papaver somniferum]